MMVSTQRTLICALLFSLLSACGGSQSSSTEEKSATGVEASAPESAPASEEATLARAATLNTASLEAAEKRAQAAEGRATSTDLDSLAPGQIAPKSAYASGDIARKALAVGITAYRFYNTRSGAHFYTVSQAERDNVRNKLSPPYSYEGEAFRVASAYAPGLSPVHRFYNTRNGVHFYTISETERAYVAANLPHYTYEGVAYHASEVAGANLIPFHRFYVPTKGFHFYTASEEEKNHIIANLGAVYRYEGVGYHVLDTGWRDEKLAHSGVTTCYRAGSNVLQTCNAQTEALNPLQDGNTALIKGGLDYEEVPNPGGGNYFRDECIRDKVTGLVWEGKHPSPTHPRYGGAVYTQVGGGAADDASGHVAAVNASRLCGFSDWRMPSLTELHGLVDYSRAQGPMVSDWLLFTLAGDYWSSDLRGAGPYIRTVGFGAGDGHVAAALGTERKGVRLVRGSAFGAATPRFSFTTIAYTGDAANNVVNDAWTGLQWRRCLEGIAWNGTTCVGNSAAAQMTHEAALNHARQKIGWRVPNVKELTSLFPPGAGDLDPVGFPGDGGAFPFWSSSPYATDPVYAWHVNAGYAFHYRSRGQSIFLRLVRAN